MKHLALAFAFFAGAVQAATVEVSWIPPTTMVGGEFIPSDGDEALKTTIVQWGSCNEAGEDFQWLGSSKFPHPAEAGVIEGLDNNTVYCFRAIAVNVKGERSAPSNMIRLRTSTQITAPTLLTKPNPPQNLNVREL